MLSTTSWAAILVLRLFRPACPFIRVEQHQQPVRQPHHCWSHHSCLTRWPMQICYLPPIRMQMQTQLRVLLLIRSTNRPLLYKCLQCHRCAVRRICWRNIITTIRTRTRYPSRWSSAQQIRLEHLVDPLRLSHPRHPSPTHCPHLVELVT